MSVAPALELRDCCRTFGGLKAVDHVSASVPDRALFGMIGPNGAGKTTVFNLITGVYQPTEGSILLHGRNTRGRKPSALAAWGVARTFQNIRLFPDLTVLENVRIACQLRERSGLWDAILRTGRHARSEAEVLARAEKLLTLFGLAEFAGWQSTSLPYGEQRRLEIARALATEPRVLLLDEPAAGMNPQEKVELMELIRRVRDEFKVAVLLIEHDMQVVMGICEHIYVLDYGQMIAEGTPEAVQDNPKVIEAYLGEEV